MISSLSRKAAVIAFWLIVWEVLTVIIGSDIILVSPRVTFARLFSLAGTAAFWQSIFTSMMRILRGFLFALGGGVALAAVTSRFALADMFVSPAVRFFNAVPVASFTVLALMVFHSSNLSVFIAFITVLPIIYINTQKGIQSTDPALLEMAGVFRVPFYKRVFYIYYKSVLPYVASAASVGIGFAWKSGIAAELIGVVSGTVGAYLHRSRIFLDTAGLFAWTIAIVCMSFLMERLFRFLFARLQK